jgi:hypothetical protein
MNKNRQQFDELINNSCKYIATGDSAFLRTAKSKCSDPAICAFLESDNLTTERQVFPNEYQSLLELLSNANRGDEAAIIEILARRFVALATREIATYPEEERRFIFNTCEELAMLSSERGFVF